MLTIRALTTADLPALREQFVEHWGGPEVISRERRHVPEELEGLVAEEGGAWAGTLTYRVAEDGASCELVTLLSLIEGRGVATALIAALSDELRRRGCRRLWLITTNDNTPALRFYQRRGFELAALHRGAVEHARALKPSIPLVGVDDIPIRDEIELVLPL